MTGDTGEALPHRKARALTSLMTPGLRTEPIRSDNRQAELKRVRLRRALVLMVMTLVMPGSAQLVAGRKDVGKWALRQVLYRRVPRALVERPKMGFTVPIDQWLRGPLRPWAEGLLLDPAADRERLLDPAKVAGAWKAFTDGRGSGGLGLWAVLMLRAWTQRWAA